jgi:hypothetical protein
MAMSLSPDSSKVIWDCPGWRPYSDLKKRVLHKISEGCTVAEALNAVRHPHFPVRFVPQSELPPTEAYEIFIFEHGRIPTRDLWHDLLNGLVWLRFPELKKRLNLFQAQEIRKLPLQGGKGIRGSIRDRLTIFDENAALWQPSLELEQALRARNWKKLFVELKCQWQDKPLLLIGHALMEKLLQPRKDITAHIWLIPHDKSLSRWICELDASFFSQKNWLPMPILGIPNWYWANQEEGFYDDPQVFRPLPSALSSDYLLD